MARHSTNYRISDSIASEARERTLKQESIYGHNTGHFTLDVEKQNTSTGVFGELVTREVAQAMLRKQF